MTRNEDDNPPSCCGGGRKEGMTDKPSTKSSGETTTKMDRDLAPASTIDTERMVRIDEGEFTMGTDSNVGYPEDGEGPAREVFTDAYYVDQHAVTNGEFYQFVEDTGYTTDAEEYGWSFVFTDFVPAENGQYIIDSVDDTPWWDAVRGANWLRPEGPNTSITDRLTHPVVHVSHSDARAYANWADKRLPTEAEWEKAARGEKSGALYPWGDELIPGDEWRMNIWQGSFPEKNTVEDGFKGTAPVDEFDKQNEFDLYNITGNVWEWCHDWFSSTWHKETSTSLENPVGPSGGSCRVIRGGSHLCHDSWCNRYRVAARSKNTPDSTTGNIGFRCVADNI